VFDVLKDGDEEGGGDGDGAGQQHPGKTGPAQVQEALQENQSGCGVKTARRLQRGSGSGARGRIKS